VHRARLPSAADDLPVPPYQRSAYLPSEGLQQIERLAGREFWAFARETVKLGALR
jgi:hypothetical protein